MRQRDPDFGPFGDRVAMAHACGLNPEDLHPTLNPQGVSTGLPFCVIPVRSVEALGRLRVRHELDDLLAGTGSKFAYVIAPAGSPAEWRARMQFYNGEDPATGSAAGGAISYLVRHGAIASGERCVIRQGVEMLRPSLIEAAATLLPGDAVTDVFVGGRTIPVAAGTFMLP
jgi:trans-2,3-dihydro-3-hydroxyanthranilate isomerase